MGHESLKKKVEQAKNPDRVSFWFVRHAESEDNTLGEKARVMHDTPLTKKGEEEAKKLAKYFEDNSVTITHIFSAATKRSKQTAEIIGDELEIPVTATDGLNERNWGALKNTTWKELAGQLGSMSLDERYKFLPAEGETWEEMEDRLFSELEKIAEAAGDGENILIVTHRGCLRAVLPVLAKAGREKHEEYSVPLSSLSKFSFEKDEFDFVGLVPD